MTIPQLAHKTASLAIALIPLAAIPVTSLCTAACGPNIAEVVAPKPKTYVEAVENGECKRDGVSGNPLIVDWPPEQRGDLEVAMKEGVPVVRYTCDRFELLRNCRIKGSYEYLGMTRKEQLVRIMSRDELRANLPFSSIGLPANIKGDLDRDAALDIALIMVGKKSTSLTSASADQMEGDCQGATHFVRRATLGAFAMDVGTKAQAGAVAGLFQFQAQHDSKYQKRLYNKDGELEACKQSTSSSDGAPEQCGALLRLELAAVGALPQTSGHGSGTPNLGTAQVQNDCPKGMHPVSDKCEWLKASCAGAACDAECDAGVADACIVAGARFEATSPERVARLSKSCKLGYDEGCRILAWVFPHDAAEQTRKDLYDQIAARCEGGGVQACFDAGEMLLKGKDVAKDSARALAMLERACKGGNTSACLTVAIDAQKRTPAKAVRYIKFACTAAPKTLDESEACLRLARAHEEGSGVSRDGRQATEYLRRACSVTPGALDRLQFREDGRIDSPEKQACAALSAK